MLLVIHTTLVDILVSCQLTFFQIAKHDNKGEIMQGCNDCSFDYHGNLWVTAPAAGIAPHPYRRSFEVNVNGRLAFCLAFNVK